MHERRIVRGSNFAANQLLVGIKRFLTNFQTKVVNFTNSTNSWNYFVNMQPSHFSVPFLYIYIIYYIIKEINNVGMFFDH